MYSKSKAAFFTMFAAVFNMLGLIVYNLIYTNYIIRIYGSSVNGLISTLNQFVGMFSIFEGGITTAVIVSLFEPISKQNYEKVNNILYTCRILFFRIGLVVTFLSLFTGFFFCKYINSPLPFISSVYLLVIATLTSALSLCYLVPKTVILSGYNSEYIYSFVNFFSKSVIWVLSLLLMLRNADIVIVFGLNIFNIILNIFIITICEKKKYPQITNKGVFNLSYIKGSKDVVLQKITSVVFTSTDLVLVSCFIDLASSSVYNLYFLVYKAISNLLNSIVQAPFNSFGLLFQSKDVDSKFEFYFKIYHNFTVILSGITLTCCGMLMLPFVRIFTAKVFDFNYQCPSLVYLFYAQMYFQIVNRPYGAILNVTGNFDLQNKQCVYGTIINIFLSYIFIDYIGINSVILGSLVATIVILIMNIKQVDKYVVKNIGLRNLRCIALNFMLGLVLIFLSINYDISINNYFTWIYWGIIDVFIVSVLFIVFNFFVDFHSTNNMIKVVWNILKSKRLII